MTFEEEAVTRDALLEQGFDEAYIKRVLHPEFIAVVVLENDRQAYLVPGLFGLNWTYFKDSAKVFPTYEEAYWRIEEWQGVGRGLSYRPEEGWVEQL